MRKSLDKHSIISSNQYGFRSSLSTTHAMLDVLTFTYDNINDNTITALLLFDLNKAFDRVQHDILLRKLEHYDIRCSAQNLIASFLRNRQQYVSLHNAQSHKMYITCGVPQGSVLGPLLFTLYINGIVNCTSSTPRLFADNTCLILQHKNLADLNVKINTEIKAIENYMNANKLTLNISKSNVIVINSNSKNNNLTSDLIASKLSLVQNARYLERATPFYSQLKILELKGLIKLETAVLVFKIKNKTLPAQFYNYINKVGYHF